MAILMTPFPVLSYRGYSKVRFCGGCSDLLCHVLPRVQQLTKERSCNWCTKKCGISADDAQNCATQSESWCEPNRFNAARMLAMQRCDWLKPQRVHSRSGGAELIFGGMGGVQRQGQSRKGALATGLIGRPDTGLASGGQTFETLVPPCETFENDPRVLFPGAPAPQPQLSAWA